MPLQPPGQRSLILNGNGSVLDGTCALVVYVCATHVRHPTIYSMNSLQQTATPPALPGVRNPPPLAASASWLGRAAGSVALLRGEEEKENSSAGVTGTPTSADKLANKVQAQLVMSDVSPPPASGMLKLADGSKVGWMVVVGGFGETGCAPHWFSTHTQDNTPKKRSLIPALRLGGGGGSDKGVPPLSTDAGVAAGKKALPNVAAKQLSIKGGSSSSGGKQLMSL